jgi:photosystem II stability/assembly factor-like uncharacterized protein
MTKVSVLMLLILLTFSIAPAQWSHTGGPAGEGITSLAVKGNFVLAGAKSGVIYRSSDKGASWNKLQSLTGNHTRIIVDDSILYATTEGGGLFRSTNDGDAWTSMGANLPTTYINTFCALGSDIFIGTQSGLYRSSNNGGSWSLVNTGATGTYFSSVVISHSIIAASAGNELYVSTNKGTSWTSANSDLAGAYISTLTIDGSTMYAGSSSSLYRSTNNGAQWNKIGSTMLNIECVFANSGAIYVGSLGSGVYRSTDGGVNFSKISEGMSSNNIRTITEFGGTLFAGDYVDGIYRSITNGNSWNISNKGLQEQKVSTLAILQNAQGASTIFAGAASVSSLSNSLMRSTDNGTSWAALLPPLRLTDNPSIAAMATTVLVGGEDGYVGRSNDAGASWKLLPLRPSGTIKALHIRTSTMLAGFDWYGIYRSTNNGESWDTTSMPYQTYRTIYSIASNDSVFFMCTREGFYRSNDDGKTWIKKSTGLPSFISEQSMTMATVQNSVIIAGDAGVFRTTDRGESWTSSTSGLPLGRLLSVVATGSVFYACINGKGIYRSTDFGNSWKEFNEGLNDMNIYSLGVSNNEIFAGSLKGLWKRSSGATSVSGSVKSSVLKKYSLDQNYPNPFNPSTAITFHVQQDGNVSVKIYDLLGKNVATLVSGQFASGSYTTQWNASGFSSGVYLMRMESGKFSETKRIVLMK